MLTVCCMTPATAQSQSENIFSEFSGNIGFEYRHFLNSGLYDEQVNDFYAMSVQPEYLIEWDDGKYAVNFTGFARIDFNDEQRNHWDIRELYFQTVEDRWDFSIGFKKIYWGVTEAVHLVDIINQTDNLETFDGEQKLGQLMGHYSYISNIGTFDVFAMTLFRKREFPGVNGRLRTPVPINSDQISFESDLEKWRPDFSIRWSHYFGPLDIGISHFYGTGREPMITGFDTSGRIMGFYPIINQTGLDVQATTGPILWKFETILRKSSVQDMFAFDAGFEYTFGNIGGSGIDFGLIGEYLFDDRGNLAFSSLQSDIFAGGRLAINDTQSTQFLFGGIFDLERSTKLYSLEASRRFGQSFTGNIEMRLFTDVSEQEFIYLFRDDSFLKADVSWHF
ncbi:MAG: hypothetical protein JXR07_05160 [Reichenbachiella sp.]